MENSNERRDRRLVSYNRLRAERPDLFANPPGAAYEILFDRADQESVADGGAEIARTLRVPEEYGDIGVVYQDLYVTVVKDAVCFPDGRKGAYIRYFSSVEGTGAAAFPLLSDNRVVLVHHFRHASRTWHWEIPRGFGEPGADGARTARREAEEELGCSVTEVVRLGSMNPDSGLGAGFDEIYLARIDAADFTTDLSAGAFAEGIDEIRAVSWPEFLRMLREGEINDAYTLCAYAFLIARGLAPAET